MKNLKEKEMLLVCLENRNNPSVSPCYHVYIYNQYHVLQEQSLVEDFDPIFSGIPLSRFGFYELLNRGLTLCLEKKEGHYQVNFYFKKKNCGLFPLFENEISGQTLRELNHKVGQEYNLLSREFNTYSDAYTFDDYLTETKEAIENGKYLCKQLKLPFKFHNN